MSNQLKKAAIIGGGVIGAFSAYYLRKKGWKVTVIDKDEFGNGCSYGNCGLIHPTHVLPLNMPGAVMTGLKWMFKKDAPFYIKPRLDLDLFKWLIKFTLKCNKTDMFASAAHRNALLKDSIEMFNTLVRRENISCDWENRGVIYAFRTKNEYIQHDHVDTLIRKVTNGGEKLDRSAIL